MTKSNREAAATMGGNVLDEQMAAGYRWSRRPAETHEVVSAQPGYLITGCLDEPTVDGFSDSAPSPREQVKGRSRQHPVARLRLMGIGDKFGDREQVTAERIEEVIAGFRVHPFVPVCHRFEYGQDAIGWIKRLEFDGGTLSAHVEWNAMMPVRPRCSWGLSAEVMLDARDPLTGARRGWRLTSAKPRTEPQSEPTSPREQVKARARDGLRAGAPSWSMFDRQLDMVTIAREQNSGLRDTYVVRLNGAPQFTTYDAEEALDIFAGMVTGGTAQSDRQREEAIVRRVLADPRHPGRSNRAADGGTVNIRRDGDRWTVSYSPPYVGCGAHSSFVTVDSAVAYYLRLVCGSEPARSPARNPDPAPREPVFADDAAGKRHAQRGAVMEAHMGGRAVRVAVAPGDTDAVVAENVRAALSASLRVVVGPDGRKHAVKIPSQADLDAARNPDPAPRQVWAPPDGPDGDGARDYASPDGTLAIKRVNHNDVGFCEPFAVAATWMIDPASGWRCIGIETPHGRVMVGDGFRSARGWAVEVVAVASVPGAVIIRWDDGAEPCVAAESIVGWARTRYAPARVGERYRWRKTGEVDTVSANHVSGVRVDARKWERLDPGRAERDRAIRCGAGDVVSARRQGADDLPLLTMADIVAQGPKTYPAAMLGAPVTVTSPDDVDAMFGKGSELGSIAKLMMSGEPLVLPPGARFQIIQPARTLATPGGIPAAAPEPTDEQRIAAAILERRCLDTGTPRRDGEDDAALAARLDAAEVDRLLAKAIAKGRPWLVGVAYAREGHTVALPDARAFTAALDALAAERDVDAAVETFRRARMATGPTWLRPALERAARELTGTTAERHEQAAPRVQRTRWADPCAWAEAVNFWERET